MLKALERHSDGSASSTRKHKSVKSEPDVMKLSEKAKAFKHQFKEMKEESRCKWVRTLKLITFRLRDYSGSLQKLLILSMISKRIKLPIELSS